jgi:hypothetical protein
MFRCPHFWNANKMALVEQFLSPVPTLGSFNNACGHEVAESISLNVTDLSTLYIAVQLSIGGGGGVHVTFKLRRKSNM